jgi:hypothetical protein
MFAIVNRVFYHVLRQDWSFYFENRFLPLRAREKLSQLTEGVDQPANEGQPTANTQEQGIDTHTTSSYYSTQSIPAARHIHPSTIHPSIHTQEVQVTRNSSSSSPRPFASQSVEQGLTIKASH